MVVVKRHMVQAVAADTAKALTTSRLKPMVPPPHDSGNLFGYQSFNPTWQALTFSSLRHRVSKKVKSGNNNFGHPWKKS